MSLVLDIETANNVQITGGDVMLGNKWLLEVDDLVQADVGVESSFNCVEDHDRTVSAPKVTSR